MSEIITPTPEAEESTVETFDLTTPEGIGQAIGSAGDARVADESLPVLAVLRAGMVEVAEKVAPTLTRLTGYFKKLGEGNAKSRRYFMLPDGGPDWAATTQAFKLVSESVYDIAFPVEKFSTNDRNRNANAIRQHINRTYLDIAIREYVQDTSFPEVNGGDPLDTTREEGKEPKVIGSDVPETPDFLFKVKGEYKRTGLSVPDAYLSPQEREAKRAGTAPQVETNPGSAAMSAVAGLSSVTPKYHALSILRGLSDLATRLHEGGEVQDRAEVKEIVLRSQVLVAFARKALDGKASPDDWEALSGALFTEEDAKA